jgi:hypothetical protein
MIFNVPRHIEMIRNGTKTQTRRLNRGVYQVGRDYAVQCKRGVKAEEDIRIVMDRIWEEKGGDGILFPQNIEISFHDTLAEGDYGSYAEYEVAFKKAYPKWDGKRRWAFRFHTIVVQK